MFVIMWLKYLQYNANAFTAEYRLLLTEESAMTLLEKFILVSLLLVLSVTALQAQGLYTFTQCRVLARHARTHVSLMP